MYFLMFLVCLDVHDEWSFLFFDGIVLRYVFLLLRALASCSTLLVYLSVSL